MSDPDRNVASVQAVYEAFGRGDVPAILDRLADDVAWEQAIEGYGVPIYEPGTGKEHVARFFARVAEVEFLRFEPTNFLVGGGQVAVPIRVHVRVPATGGEVDTLEIHLWTFGDDGLVTAFDHVVDRHGFVLAYGL